ncbi:hypothetical protein HAALTHF_25450n [Vreelandella aquamarina]|nr:hypothetical protein HAALTHF_25450n [Halomonas axialensis]
MLLEGVTSDAPEPLAHKLIEVIEEPLSAGGVTLQVSTSIGVALFVHDAAETPQELLKRADEGHVQRQTRRQSAYRAGTSGGYVCPH